jgi:glucose-6-phosphate isomerase, archaeal
MSDVPFTFTLPFPALIPSHYDGHIQRRLSSLRGQFLDSDAYEELLAVEDSLVYEVYEIHRPEVAGEILSGISIVHPGRVGREFFMTKGHFHTVIDTAEIYICMQGEGCMVMETPDGETCVETLAPETVLYVPPKWAHRSVCTSRQQNLVTFFACPGHAGHDYGTIERQGFRRLVLEGRDGRIEIVANPRWGKP